jgi:ubiquinone/menaquinone biosynthesis C-methylase UbiE
VDEILNYWSERARDAHGAPTATTNDIGMRELEGLTLAREIATRNLPAGGHVLDIGCGDGKTTLHLAREFPDLQVFGIDFSPEMITAAETTLREGGFGDRVRFEVGDVRKLADAIGGERFDVITTNRCLINLTSGEEQYDALAQIAGHLAPGGAYLGTENFLGGQAAMNALRRAQGLPEIAVRWHNLFFDEAEFLRRAAPLFSAVELENFSSIYYLVTRVVYSALCQQSGIAPDYGHPIHKIAVSLPTAGDFSPIKLIRAFA